MIEERSVLDTLQSDLEALQRRVRHLEQLIPTLGSTHEASSPTPCSPPAADNPDQDPDQDPGPDQGQGQGAQGSSDEWLRWLFIGWFLTRDWPPGGETRQGLPVASSPLSLSLSR